MTTKIDYLAIAHRMESNVKEALLKGFTSVSDMAEVLRGDASTCCGTVDQSSNLDGGEG